LKPVCSYEPPTANADMIYQNIDTGNPWSSQVDYAYWLCAHFRLTPKARATAALASNQNLLRTPPAKEIRERESAKSVRECEISYLARATNEQCVLSVRSWCKKHGCLGLLRGKRAGRRYGKSASADIHLLYLKDKSNSHLVSCSSTACVAGVSAAKNRHISITQALVCRRAQLFARFPKYQFLNDLDTTVQIYANTTNSCRAVPKQTAFPNSFCH